MDLNSYLLYVSVSFFYVISPGLAVFLVIQYAALFSYKSIFMLILGNVIGLGILAFVSAIGIGTVISNSEVLTNIIKLLGSLVLFYLGSKMIFSTKSIQVQSQAQNNEKTMFKYFKEGLLLAVTNPKPIVFFGSIYPQFIVNDNKSLQFFILAITFMLISFISLHVYAYISKNTIGKVLNQSKIKVFNVISGLALIITSIILIIN